MQLLVAATSSALPDSGIPEEIVYIPEGVHEITPTINGKPGKITVKMMAEAGERIAAAFQSDLSKRLADNVRPIIDFDHKSIGPAAGIPKSFRYEAGKGLMMAVDWTRAGKEAIEGRDFSYSSPTFLLANDGSPSGLPERGPVAALVNHPAFRSITRIAASDQNLTPDTNHKDTMSKLILAALKVDDTRTDAEAIGVQRIEAMQAEVSALEKERDELKTKVEASEKLAKETAEKRADDLVKAAAIDGRIAPKDEKAQAFYRKYIAAGDTDAEEALKALPKLNAHITTTFVKAGESRLDSSEHTFIAKSKQLIAAGDAADIDAAMDLVMAKDPSLYDDYCRSIHA